MDDAGAMEWTWEEKSDFEEAMAQVPNTPAKLEIIAAEMRDEKLVKLEYSTRSPTPFVPQSKRRTRWSAEEHKRFLQGLKALGAGDWKGISRNFVKTRDAIQVGAYGKRFLNKDKKQD